MLAYRTCFLFFTVSRHDVASRCAVSFSRYSVVATLQDTPDHLSSALMATSSEDDPDVPPKQPPIALQQRPVPAESKPQSNALCAFCVSRLPGKSYAELDLQSISQIMGLVQSHNDSFMVEYTRKEHESADCVRLEGAGTSPGQTQTTMLPGQIAT